MAIPDLDAFPIYNKTTVDELSARMSEGESLFPKLFEIFQEESPKLIAEIKASFEARNVTDAYEAIHQLKGSSAAMGATRLYELTQGALELACDDRIFSVPNLIQRIQKEVTDYETSISSLGA